MDSLGAGLVVAASWFIGGTVGGATAVGAVMVAMPLLTLVLSPGDAVLVACLVGFPATLHLAWSYRKAVTWRDLRDMVIGVVPGSMLGWAVLKFAPVQVLQLLVSAMLACFVILQLFRRFATWRLPDSTLVGVAGGCVTGLVGSSVAMTGAPLGIYVLLKGWDPDRARGNMSGFHMFPMAGAVLTQTFSGMYTMSLLEFALFGLAGCIVGQMLGVRLGRHIDQNLFKRIVLFFLSVAAVILFVRALG